MPKGGGHFFSHLRQRLNTLCCMLCSQVPTVALGREWSGGRLKEISGGLKTAHAESKKKVGGGGLPWSSSG